MSLDARGRVQLVFPQLKNGSILFLMFLLQENYCIDIEAKKRQLVNWRNQQIHTSQKDPSAREHLKHQ